jgi:hypothetical protein
MFDFLSGPMDSRQKTRLALMAIILLTLPCYCLGMVLLAYAPSGTSTPRPQATSPTLGGMTIQPVASITPFMTATFTPYGAPLQATPFQLYLPTNTPFYIQPTQAPLPTLTIPPTLTSAPTITIAPSPTLMPTNPPLPTDIPLPTATTAPLPTDVPPPTDASIPTDVPPPTQEVLSP